jgi:hypothetical protein
VLYRRRSSFNSHRVNASSSVNNLTPSDVPSFSLVFRPSIYLISLVRQFVENFYAKVIGDPNVVSRLALTTHELLENAAKYSSDGSTSLYVEVDPKNGSVLVRTANPATATEIDSLRRWFAEIAAGTAPALYAEMMRRSAARKLGSGGLGIARIWAEGEMEMELGVEGDIVQIVARGRIDAG